MPNSENDHESVQHAISRALDEAAARAEMWRSDRDPRHLDHAISAVSMAAQHAGPDDPLLDSALARTYPDASRAVVDGLVQQARAWQDDPRHHIIAEWLNPVLQLLTDTLGLRPAASTAATTAALPTEAPPMTDQPGSILERMRAIGPLLERAHEDQQYWPHARRALNELEGQLDIAGHRRFSVAGVLAEGWVTLADTTSDPDGRPTPGRTRSRHLGALNRAGRSPPYGLVIDPDSRNKPEFFIRSGANTYPAQPSDLRQATLNRAAGRRGGLQGQQSC
jgi:hypothetical protein